MNTILRQLRLERARLGDRADDWSAALIGSLGRLRPSLPILAILLLAFLLRINEVRQPLIDAFSWRQASTAMMADNYYRTSPNIFFPEVSWTGPGPNYQGREFQLVTYTASLLYRVFGQHEVIGRMIGVVMGTWGVFALFRLASLVWNRDAAHWVALAMATLPGAIFIDRSFLPDPTMLSLSITTVWLYLEYLCSGRRKFLVLTGIVGTLAWLTKLPGIITLVPMIYATITVLRTRRALSLWSIRPILLTLLLMIIPIACYYAWAVYLGTHYPPYHIAGAANWVWKDGVMKWVGQNYFLKPIAEGTWLWLWTWPYIAMAGLGLLFLPPGSERAVADTDPRLSPLPANLSISEAPPHPAKPAAPWMFHWWFVGFLFIFAIGARELRENPWNFHVLNVVPAAFAGHFLYRFSRVQSDRLPLFAVRTRALVVALIAMVVGQWIAGSLYNSRARDSMKLGHALNRISKPEDLVVTIADDVGDPIAIYYSHRRGWVFPPAHMPETWKPFNLIPPDSKKSKWMLEDLRGRGAKYLGIVEAPKDDTPGRTNFWADHPDLVKYINQTCEFIEKTESHVIYRIKTPEELRRKPASGS